MEINIIEAIINCGGAIIIGCFFVYKDLTKKTKLDLLCERMEENNVIPI